MLRQGTYTIVIKAEQPHEWEQSREMLHVVKNDKLIAIIGVLIAKKQDAKIKGIIAYMTEKGPRCGHQYGIVKYEKKNGHNYAVTLENGTVLKVDVNTLVVEK